MTELHTPNSRALSVSFSIRMSNPFDTNRGSVIFRTFVEVPGFGCGASPTRVEVNRVSHADFLYKFMYKKTTFDQKDKMRYIR